MNKIKSKFISLNKIFKFEFFIANVSLFLTLAFLGMLALNLSVFDPFKNALKDFNYNDLIYSRLIDQNENFDTNIVLVNIAHLNRLEIAEQINIIRSHNPKVIALDGFFSQQRDSLADCKLKQQLSVDNKFIMAIAMSDYDKKSGNYNSIEKSDSFFCNGNYGHINLGGDKPKSSTIRRFKPVVNHKDTVIYSISAQIVRKYNERAFQNLIKRGNEFEQINYIGNYKSFYYFDYDEVLNNQPELEIIKNKIVLMGYIGKYIGDTNDLEDIYFTPLNKEISGRSHPDMYGMVIHANIISMIISGTYKNTIPLWIELLISFIVSYFYIVFHKYTSTHIPKKFSFVKQFINLFLTIIAIYIGFMLYKNADIAVETAVFIAPILLYGSFLEYYQLLLLFLNQKYGLKSIFIKN